MKNTMIFQLVYDIVKASQCKASWLQMIGSNIFIKHGQHVLFVRVNSSEKVSKASF